MAKGTKFTDEDLRLRGMVQDFAGNWSYPKRPKETITNAFGQTEQRDYNVMNAGGKNQKPIVAEKKRKVGRKSFEENQLAIHRGEKKSKYGVSKKADRTYNGVVYMSKLEMKYRKYLDTLVMAGEVQKIKEQYEFKMFVKEKLVCKYLCDLVVKYMDGRTEYVDVKGVKTAMYRLKKKFVEAEFGIKITEITKDDF